MKCLTFVIAFLLVLSAQAQTSDPVSPSSDASVIEMVNALKRRPSTRSRGARAIQVERSKLDLVVNFDFDSAQVLSESKPLLERLALAMNDAALINLRFEIQGHTDAKGSAAYNIALSQRRAEAVLDFLAENAVDRSRIQSVGKGFNELLNTQAPLSAVNRRVRVMSID